MLYVKPKINRRTICLALFHLQKYNQCHNEQIFIICTFPINLNCGEREAVKANTLFLVPDPPHLKGIILLMTLPVLE